MNTKQKKALYESIMKQVAKTVKAALNEGMYDAESLYDNMEDLHSIPADIRIEMANRIIAHHDSVGSYMEHDKVGQFVDFDVVFYIDGEMDELAEAIDDNGYSLHVEASYDATFDYVRGMRSMDRDVPDDPDSVETLFNKELTIDHIYLYDGTDDNKVELDPSDLIGIGDILAEATDVIIEEQEEVAYDHRYDADDYFEDEDF